MERGRFVRAHAHAQHPIGRLEDWGRQHLPFSDVDANSSGPAAVGFAADLDRWLQLLCLRDELRQAEPKAIRWSRWHAPGSPGPLRAADHRASTRRLA
ncbi:MAG TPA: hypothetical protein VMW47_09430 [Verrucomicrobiae bacterium]|nr:hypothetical protein [Verrucomicrobiae bacterium]